MLAHNSAGPKMDIVDTDCGFLATSVEEYADCLDRIVAMSDAERQEMVQRAREKSRKFTDRVFVQRLQALGSGLWCAHRAYFTRPVWPFSRIRSASAVLKLPAMPLVVWPPSTTSVCPLM